MIEGPRTLRMRVLTWHTRHHVFDEPIVFADEAVAWNVERDEATAIICSMLHDCTRFGGALEVMPRW